jgi:hypothetical protein
VGAAEAIFILHQELGKDDFIDSLVSLLFNVTLLSINQTTAKRSEFGSIESLAWRWLRIGKRGAEAEAQAPTAATTSSSLNFTFTSATNCTEIQNLTALLAALSVEIVPRAMLQFAADVSTCPMTTTATNPETAAPSSDEALALGTLASNRFFFFFSFPCFSLCVLLLVFCCLCGRDWLGRWFGLPAAPIAHPWILSLSILLPRSKYETLLASAIV